MPPEPPLLTANAVQAVLRDVGLLLDYLNRLPETRLDRFFAPVAAEVPPMPQRPRPPCKSQAYFLGRIAAIAARGGASGPNERTSPPVFDGALGCVDEDDAERLSDLAFLIWCRDFLSAASRPATLDTIRVTRAYRAGRMLEGVRLSEPAREPDTADERDLFMSRYGIRIARRVRRFQSIAFALLWLSLYLSFMVYSGQVLMHENEVLRGEQAKLEAQVRDAAAQDVALMKAALQPGASRPDAFVGWAFCRADAAARDHVEVSVVQAPTGSEGQLDGRDMGRVWFATAGGPGLHIFVSNRQRELCVEAERLGRRERDLKAIHGAWGAAALPLMLIATPTAFLGPRSDCDASCMELETHRYGMQQVINGLLAGIMPAMYAALGALASLFRRLATKAECEQLGPADYGGMMSSLVIGGLTGAMIGVLVNIVPQGGPQVGLPLSTTALALLAGYAADRVFAMFDGLAQRIFAVPDQPTRAG